MKLLSPRTGPCLITSNIPTNLETKYHSVLTSAFYKLGQQRNKYLFMVFHDILSPWTLIVHAWLTKIVVMLG